MKRILVISLTLLFTLVTYAGKHDYAKAVKIFQKHLVKIDGQTVFAIKYKELQKHRDSLENMSNRIILFNMAMEKDTVWSSTKNEQLVSMRKTFLNTIFIPMLGMTVDEILQIELFKNSHTKEHMLLAEQFALYLPIHGGGMRILPVENKPMLTLFF